jgi:pyruvate/2-oxoacid:ferredoxin oxidoreductase alpha subunit
MQKVLSGNKAAVYAAKLARVEVAAVYPITPQSQISEDITKVVAAGDLDCDIIEVEGEHSAMSAIIGASTVGARVFTATSSWGLAYMNEPLMVCAGMRIPAVMVDVTRETPAQRGVSTSRQDIMSIRDSGWLELDPASPQEVLDSVLMAYRLAEDSEILLPVVVASDGFYMSHAYEPVDVPTQEQVDQFLPPISKCKRTTFTDGKSMQFDVGYSGPNFVKYRYQTLKAIEHAKEVFPKVEQEFEKIFGRKYGGMVEEYFSADAEILLMTAGSASGNAKAVVDSARKHGLKVGLIRERMFRPYPKEELRRILAGKKAVGIIDRSICLGWDCGHLMQETKAALFGMENAPKLVDFIDGLSSMDITIDHIERALAITMAASKGETVEECNWLSWED